MHRLTDDLGRIIALCQKHALSCEDLEQSRRQYEAFQVPVPVIGSYNAGKSSLLNALLGSRILPVGIVAKTKVPTEITAGEDNGVTAFHPDHCRRLGLGDLRDRNADFDGVRLLHVACNNPFLRQIDRIRLVDMPGLDTLDRKQEQALRDYLPRSLAYILVFSADEPVIKESIANFLYELRLREIPVVPVLTKSDKITPGELRRARAFLEKKLGEMFGLENLSFCIVSARGDAESVRQRLLQLQERADALIERALGGRLRESASNLHTYLTLRSAMAKLAQSEMERQDTALHSRIETVRNLLKEQVDRFLVRCEECGEEILHRARENIREAAIPIETMLQSGNDPWEYTDSMLRAVLSAGLVNCFEPMAKSFAEQVAMLLKIHGTSRDAPLDAALFLEAESETGLPGSGGGLPASAAKALQSFESTRSLFEEMPSRNARGAQRQETIARDLEERIVPGLYQRCEECVREVLQQSAARIQDTLDHILSLEVELNQKALADIVRERAHPKDGFAAAQIEEDLRAAEAVLATYAHAGT